MQKYATPSINISFISGESPIFAAFERLLKIRLKLSS